MSKTLAIIMDSILNIHVEKDTSFAIFLEAQARDYEIYYFQTSDISFVNQQVVARTFKIKVYDNNKHWVDFVEEEMKPLSFFDVVLMRKDPPVDIDYIHATHLLDLAEKQGANIINRPSSLRNHNEKLAILKFSHCIAPSAISSSLQEIKAFCQLHQDIIVKPLDAMGGEGVFRLKENDPNFNAIIEMITHHGQQKIMVQRYLPEISAGDKRIILIDGEPIPYLLKRMAKSGETRANLAKGGSGIGDKLSDRDYWLCQQLRNYLVENGLRFVGLDVIGDYITEINVTSPTCIRELNKIYNINIAGIFLDKIFP